jgi:hypothetical protein
MWNFCSFIAQLVNSRKPSTDSSASPSVSSAGRPSDSGRSGFTQGKEEAVGSASGVQSDKSGGSSGSSFGTRQRCAHHPGQNGSPVGTQENREERIQSKQIVCSSQIIEVNFKKNKFNIHLIR